jgi:hypothetical protein
MVLSGDVEVKVSSNATSNPNRMRPIVSSAPRTIPVMAMPLPVNCWGALLIAPSPTMPSTNPMRPGTPKKQGIKPINPRTREAIAIG